MEHEMTRETPFYKLVVPILRLVVHILFRISLEGKDNIPKSGPFIVASNHTHNFDPAVLTAAMPFQVVFMAKREIIAKAPRWIGAGFNLYGTIFVNRGKVERKSLNKALDHLNNSGVLGVFPEGSRSTNGILQKGQAGASFLALKSKSNILPVAIIGLSGVDVSISTLFSRPQVIVRFGKPIEIAGREKGTALTSEIMDAIGLLLPGNMQGS